MHKIMNKTRHKWIEDIILRLATIREEIDDVTMEEQEAFDNLPESIQESERRDNMYENINDLEDISSEIDDLIGTLQDITER